MEVDAIDGNEDALGVMQDIMHLCHDKWDFDLRMRTVTHKAKSGFAPANVVCATTTTCSSRRSVSASSAPFPNAVPRLRVRVFDSIAPKD
ncbi:MAG: hypothetical protein ACLUHG_02280 [Sutterella wadsworthensis]